MAKSKEEGASSQSSWSPEEVAVLLQDLEAKGQALAVVTKKLDTLEPIVERLQVEMQALGPMDTSIPAELTQGVRPDMVFTSALQACLIGIIQIQGPPSASKQWETLADRALSMAEVVANKAITRYKLKQK